MADQRSLIKILEAQILEADTTASGVGAQREANHRNYAMQPLGNEQAGRSKYISPDVLDSVEAKKAIFTETFFSGRNIARFVPNGRVTQMEADTKTAYANATLQRNDAFALMRDGWHDAFVAKRMVIYARWKEMTERVTVEVTGATQEQAMMLLQQAVGNERVVDLDDSQITVQMAPSGVPMLNGALSAEVDRSMTKLTLVQPERFYRDPTAAYVSDSAFCCFEEDIPRGWLIDDGFDPVQIVTLKSDYRFGAATEDAARKAHDQSYSYRRRTGGRAREQEQVTVYYTYAWLDAQTVAGELDGDAKATGIDLYEIIWAHGEVLRWADGRPAIRVVEEMPFFEWTEYKIAHAEHGMADADVLNHTQRVNSVLKRLILDNQQMRNTPRWEAVHSAVKNPRDLIDNKIGGVVWSTRIGSVVPLPSPELSPMTMAVLQMLKQDAESRSGVTDLSKGMNTDAIKYQNAADMIERLTNASNRRIMKAARDFAETLLVPLIKHIVKLGKRHDQRMHFLTVAGQQVQVTPQQQWSDYESDCRVQVALTSQQGQQYAQQLLMLHQIIMQDPMLSQLYQLPQRHALMDEVFDALGASDSVRFLMRPDDQQVQQAQMQQAQMAQKQMMDQMQVIELEKAERTLRIQSLARQNEREDQKLKIELDKFQLEAADRAADNQRENDKLAWQKLTDTAEYKLELDQNRAAKIGQPNV